MLLSNGQASPSFRQQYLKAGRSLFFELKFVLKNKVENSGKSWAQALMSRKK